MFWYKQRCCVGMEGGNIARSMLSRFNVVVIKIIIIIAFIQGNIS